MAIFKFDSSSPMFIQGPTFIVLAEFSRPLFISGPTSFTESRVDIVQLK